MLVKTYTCAYISYTYIYYRSSLPEWRTLMLSDSSPHPLCADRAAMANAGRGDDGEGPVHVRQQALFQR